MARYSHDERSEAVNARFREQAEALDELERDKDAEAKAPKVPYVADDWPYDDALRRRRDGELRCLPGHRDGIPAQAP